jgi:PBP1b-binding outer membrane lipoprotein LpoB
MLKTTLAASAAALFLAGCISTEIVTDATGQRMRKADRATGSNIAKLKRDPDFEGWRQGFDRDDMEKIQRSGGSRQPAGGS